MRDLRVHTFSERNRRHLRADSECSVGVAIVQRRKETSSVSWGIMVMAQYLDLVSEGNMQKGAWTRLGESCAE